MDRKRERERERERETERERKRETERDRERERGRKREREKEREMKRERERESDVINKKRESNVIDIIVIIRRGSIMKYQASYFGHSCLPCCNGSTYRH